MLIFDAEIKKVKQKKYSHVEMFQQIMLRNAGKFHCRSTILKNYRLDAYS